MSLQFYSSSSFYSLFQFPNSSFKYLLSLFLLTSCSTVSHIPDDELLYVGTRHIHIADTPSSPLLDTAIGEAKVAFISPPNNSLFGSSHYRLPLPIGLWAYNAFVNDSTGLRHWFFKTFATSPILISTVNPSLRAGVASNTLRNYGYFDNHVTYHIDTLAGGRKASLSYTLQPGVPWYYGNITYLPLTPTMDSLVHSTWHHRLLREGDQFSYTTLSGERNRLFTLFREHGYYYFRSDMLQIQADTLLQPGTVQLRLGLQPAIPPYVLKPWYIGTTHLRIEGGSASRPSIRPQVIEPRIVLRRGNSYSSSAQNTTQRELNRLGIFSAVDLTFVPRDSVEYTDTLDVYITARLDKPYELSLEANLTAKSNNQVGPGLAASLSRKNFLRLAETLQLRFTGSYEWQTNHTLRRAGSAVNSFELGSELSMSVPQVLFPGADSYLRPVSTTSRLYVNWLNRGGYFRMLAFGGNLTYAFSSSDVWTHNLTPFRLTFNTLEHTTHRFDSVMIANPAIGLSFRDQYIPAISYTITYDNATRQPRHSSNITFSLTSAGAATSLLYAAAGHPLCKQNKTLFGTPFAQFIKSSIESRHYYSITPRQTIATRFFAGAVCSYGNSSVPPYSEQFHVGGASDLRAFPLRSIGPGSYHSSGRYAYIDHTGDFKLEANIEWRFPLISQLSGALFVDAGNVWLLRSDADRPGAQFQWDTFARDIALGTGFGLRYNLKILVLRADIGIPLHIPYTTAKHSYYNVPHFGRSLCLHFAVGYPF